jgi:hypothetical protein
MCDVMRDVMRHTFKYLVVCKSTTSIANLARRGTLVLVQVRLWETAGQLRPRRGSRGPTGVAGPTARLDDTAAGVLRQFLRAPEFSA